MKRAASCLALLAAVSACSKPVDVPQEVVINNVVLGQGAKVEIYADGMPAPSRELEKTDALGRRIAFEARGTLTGEKYRLPELKAKVLLGCGWRELPLRVGESWPLDEVRALAKKGEPVAYTAAMPALPGALGSLWVDNRKGKAGELGLGPLRFPVPAGKTARLDFDACDAAIPVEFDGAPIGEIPAVSSDAVDVPTVLIDPTGSRCYRRERVWYAPESSGGGGRSRPVAWSGRKVYFSPDFIAYVFEKPPAARLSFSGENPSYGVLTDAPCGK